MIKVALYLVMVMTAVIVTFVVGPRLKQRRQAVDQGKKDLTPDELSQFDGKEGRPAYFAYSGKIYDATGRRLWKGGNHVAGCDLDQLFAVGGHRGPLVAYLDDMGDPEIDLRFDPPGAGSPSVTYGEPEIFQARGWGFPIHGLFHSLSRCSPFE